jgi:hypothetical protein
MVGLGLSLGLGLLYLRLFVGVIGGNWLWSGVDGGLKVVMGVFLCSERRLWVCDWGEVCFFPSLQPWQPWSDPSKGESSKREREAEMRERERRE